MTIEFNPTIASAMLRARILRLPTARDAFDYHLQRASTDKEWKAVEASWTLHSTMSDANLGSASSPID